MPHDWVRLARLLTTHDAALLQATLRAAGIETELRGEQTARLGGGVVVPTAFAELWVQAPNLERASLILTESTGRASTEVHACPACGEENPASFLSCWKCGADRDGDSAVPEG